jgi:hypothetical protein
MGLADKLACLVANLVTAIVMLAATALYFTGIPILRDIPFIGHVPLIGAIAEGEIARRTAGAHAAGEMEERLKWQEQRDKDLAVAEAERRQKQSELDTIKTALDLERAVGRARDLQAADDAEQKANDDEKTADPACHRPPAVSRRVRDSLQNIGR